MFMPDGYFKYKAANREKSNSKKMYRFAIKNSSEEYWTGNKPPEVKAGRNGKPSSVKSQEYVPIFSDTPYFWPDEKTAKFAFMSYAAIRSEYPNLPELRFVEVEVGFIKEKVINVDTKQRREAERIHRLYGSTLANAFFRLKLKNDDEADQFVHVIKRKGNSAKNLNELGIPDAYSSGVFTFIKHDTDLMHIIMAMSDNFDKSWTIR